MGRRDERGLDEAIAAGGRAYVQIALLTLAAGLAVTPAIGWFARDLNAAGMADLRWAWIVGLASFLTLPLLPLRTVVEARQLGYVINLMLIVQSVFITGLSLTLAAFGWGSRARRPLRRPGRGRSTWGWLWASAAPAPACSGWC